VSGTASFTNSSTSSTAANKNITLTNTSNDFGTFAASAGNNVSVTDINSLILGALSASGLTVVTATTNTNSGAITQSGALTLTGPSSFTNSSTSSTSGYKDITLTNSSNNFGDSAVALSGGNVQLTDSNTSGLILGAITAGALNVTSNAAITQNATMNVSGESTFTAGSGHNITLNNSNAINLLKIISGNNVSVTDSSALALDVSSISGNLGLSLSNGMIQVGGNTSVTGTTTVSDSNTGTNDVISLGHGDFTGAVSVTGAHSDVAIINDKALNLGASTVGGTFEATINGTGNITQSGALAITGTSTLVAGSGNDITLTNPNNDFSTVTVSSGHDVNLTDTNALTLGAVTTANSFTASSVDALTLTDDITTPTLSLIATDTTNGYIEQTAGTISTTTSSSFESYGARVVSNPPYPDAYLGIDLLENFDSSNQFHSLSMISHYAGGSAQANGIGATSVTGSTNNGLFNTQIKNGNLTAGSGGINSGSGILELSINGAGNVAVDGNLTSSNLIDLSANGNTITQQAGTTLSGPVAMSNASTATLNNTGALELGDVNVVALSATASGDITQAADTSVSVAGTTTLAAGSTHDITLNNTGNQLNIVAITSGDNVSVTDSSALALDVSTIAGNLGLTLSNGMIQVGGNTSVTGTTTVSDSNTGTNDVISLGHGDFTGAVSVTGAHSNVAIINDKALNLAASTVGGTFEASATGNITQNGAFNTTGDLSLTGTNIVNNAAIDAGTHAVTLDATATNQILTLANNITAGQLTLDAAGTGSSINQTSGVINASTGTALQSTAGATLSQAGGNYGTVTTTGNNVGGLLSVTETDATPLALGAITSSGLTASTSGALTQTGALTETGDVSLTGASINTSSDINVGSHNITLDATGTNQALSIGQNLTAGTVTLEATGTGSTINQTGGVINASVNTTVESSGDTTLSQTGGDYGAVTTTGNQVGGVLSITETDATALNLGAITSAGLTASTGATLTQIGALTETGDVNLSGASINSNSAINVGTHAASLAMTGNNQTLSFNDITAGQVTLAATGTNDNINQTGGVINASTGTALESTGTTTLSQGSGNYGSISTTGNGVGGLSVTETVAAPINLGAITDTGNLTVITNNAAITAAGALHITGTSTFDAGTANVSANNSGNNLSTLDVTAANAVSVTNNAALNLDTINATSFTANSTGTMTLLADIIAPTLNLTANNGTGLSDGFIKQTGAGFIGI